MSDSPSRSVNPPAAPRLRPLSLRVRRAPGAPRGRIRAALEAHGEPLRWAITAVDGEELWVEAVVLETPPIP